MQRNMKRYYPAIGLGICLYISAVFLAVNAFQGNTDGNISHYRYGYSTAKGRYLAGALACTLIGTAALCVGWNGWIHNRRLGKKT